MGGWVAEQGQPAVINHPAWNGCPRAAGVVSFASSLSALGPPLQGPSHFCVDAVRLLEEPTRGNNLPEKEPR